MGRWFLIFIKNIGVTIGMESGYSSLRQYKRLANAARRKRDNSSLGEFYKVLAISLPVFIEICIED